MNTTQTQVLGGIVLAGIITAFAFAVPVSASPLFANTASAGYGGQDKVEVCHKNKKTLTIAAPAVNAHLGHGDVLGACS